MKSIQWIRLASTASAACSRSVVCLAAATGIASCAAALDVGKVMYRFVQSFQPGTLERSADNELHMLSLGNGLGQTLHFGERPSRDVGAGPTETFMEGLGFRPQNRSNAL